MVSINQPEIIFGVIEASLGISTAMTYSGFGIHSLTHSYNLLIGLGCLGGLVPLLMRWSLKFWQSGSLSKSTELVTCIWATCCYLVGGIMIIVAINDNSGTSNNSYYIVVVLSLIVGIITLVDMILGLK